MSIVKKIIARQIFDARGTPTVEVDLYLDDGSFGRASIPSGASVGKEEAKEIRDGFKDYYGKGVSKVIAQIEGIVAPALLDKIFNTQSELDNFLIALDGTEDKSVLGANGILPLSIAFAKAQAKKAGDSVYRHLGRVNKYRIPTPMFNIINGGKHADNGLDIQEFMIVPSEGLPIDRQLQIGQEVSISLKNRLQSMSLSVNVGDEGGFAPQISDHKQAIELLIEAIADAGYADQARIALDIASSEFYDGTFYNMGGNKFTSEELRDHYISLVQNYGEVVSFEDPFADTDHYGWGLTSDIVSAGAQVIGDDIFVTNSVNLARGIERGYGNAILIKPNQIGTLTETLNTIYLAAENGYNVIVSHRSGETEDSFISHLSVAAGAQYIKAGALCRGERVAKYNELLRIAEEFADLR